MSALNTNFGGNLFSRFDPLIVTFELQTKPLIIHPQISVATTGDRLWHDLLHFLRHHADIGDITTVVAEAIEAEAVLEMTKQRDIVLEPRI